MSRLEETIEALFDAQTEYETRMSAQVKAESDYKVAKAKKMLQAKTVARLSSVADREAWVLTEIEKEYLTYLNKTGRLDTQKQRINVLRSVLNGLQTLSAEQRSMGETV